MANITAVTPLSDWNLREIPSFTKLNSQLYSKLGTLYANQQIIDASMLELLQGAEGGPEQAALLFHRPAAVADQSAAPSGWTKDTSNNGMVIRITDGSTLPPGAAANCTGGQTGGDWTITGVSADAGGAHTHTLSTHVHTMSHTHTVHSGGHTHSLVHTHSGDHFHSMNYDAPGTGLSGYYMLYYITSGANGMGQHSHTASHTHSSTSASITSYSQSVNNVETVYPSTDSQSAANTDTPSPASTGNADFGGAVTTHTHSTTWDGTWRPQYIDFMLCKKDTRSTTVPDSVSSIPWMLLEHPSDQKMTRWITNQINYLITNNTSQDTDHRALLVGASDVNNQARLLFSLTSAPTGWTQESSGINDRLIRVVSGAAGSTGGSWTLSGMSGNVTDAAGAHDHSMSHTHGLFTHTHTFNHQHSFPHTHNFPSHGHTQNDGGAVLIGGDTDADYFAVGASGHIPEAHFHWWTHTHSIGNSGAWSSGATTVPTSTASDPATPVTTGATPDATSTISHASTAAKGTHTHAISYGTWRPLYLDIIICEKNTDTALTAVTAVDRWYSREIPLSSKLSAQLTSKINTTITNQTTINTNHSNLLQGSSGGTERARLFFSQSAAPTGWIRQGDPVLDPGGSQRDDYSIRVSSGAGGGTGGSWVISGLSIGATSDSHLHSMQSHTHGYDHGHTSGSSHRHYYHYHQHSGLTHTHTIGATTGTIAPNTDIVYRGQGSSPPYWAVSNWTLNTHNAVSHSHSGTLGGISTDYTGYDTVLWTSYTGVSPVATSGATAPASATTDTSTDGAHLHTISHVGGPWRPEYLNVLLCIKD